MSVEQSGADFALPNPRRPSRIAYERRFFTVISLLLALVVVAGFSRTYYLRGAFQSSSLSPLLHLHGALFTMWIALFIVQVQLVRYRRIDLHRSLGIAGAVLAAGMLAVVLPMILAVTGRLFNAGSRADAYEFFATVLGDAVLFAVLVASGLALRRRAHLHKRLMLLATIALLPAVFVRLPLIPELGHAGYFGGTDLFVAALVLADLLIWKRVHPVVLWTAILFIASQPARVLLSGMAWWQELTRWVIP